MNTNLNIDCIHFLPLLYCQRVKGPQTPSPQTPSPDTSGSASSKMSTFFAFSNPQKAGQSMYLSERLLVTDIQFPLH